MITNQDYYCLQNECELILRTGDDDDDDDDDVSVIRRRRKES